MSYDIIITSATFDCVSDGFLKTDVARITKLDIYMFHDVSWKSIYFGVERSKVKVGYKDQWTTADRLNGCCRDTAAMEPCISAAKRT